MKKTNAIRMLEKQKIPFKLLEYTYDPENLDVQKIATDNGLDAGLVYKTLVAQGDKSGPIVAVIPGDRVLDLKAFAKASGNKKVAMIKVADLEKITGYIRGGCSPVGMKKNFPVYVDQRAKDDQHIWVNAGVRGVLFMAKVEDLLGVTRGVLVDIST